MDHKPLGDSQHPQSQRPAPPMRSSSGSGTGWIVAAVLVGVMVVGACPCLGIATALLLPAVQSARMAARTMQSSNNLKQIGLALHSYNMAYGTLPPAYIPDENGRPMTSWRTLILPFLEQQNLYDTVDLEKPWDDSANAMATDVDLSVYRSPRAPGNNPGITNYVAVTGEGTVMPGGETTGFDDVQDGTTNTIMIVEILNSDIAWAEPRDIDINTLRAVDLGASPNAVNVMPRRGVVLFADGSVQRMDENVTQELLREFLTRDGGEVLSSWPGN